MVHTNFSAKPVLKRKVAAPVKKMEFFDSDEEEQQPIVYQAPVEPVYNYDQDFSSVVPN